MSSSTIMKSMSEYRLSSHFGIFGAGSSEQRLSRFLPGPHDQRVSFVERNLSSHVKLVQSRRDVAPSLWGCVRMKKPLQQFCTGSRYLGEWNALGFSGDGIYRYPHGVIYEGEFNKNGLFHGLGTLLYPNGQRLQGMWKNGRLEEDQTYIFACNEVFDENFKYCQQPDRRFHVEIQKDFGPVGQEFLTADQPTKKLRKGCYDVGLGFYDPNDGCIFSYPKKTRTSFSRRNKPVSFSVDEERIRQISEISKVMKNDKYFSYVGGKDDQFESNDGCNIFEARDNPLLLDEAPPRSFAKNHPSGWINAEIFIYWFQKFIEFSRPSAENPVLLILDGHTTHTMDLMDLILFLLIYISITERLIVVFQKSLIIFTSP
ncbi:uncharacterized protein isoform X2 [Leptinotarsa decemlineata]|uniref:uncharacterized protein isoform X2 n=1 Tax=Leptinotarsa decemlineata TaxID=7539 RepID=UPI003D30C375